MRLVEVLLLIALLLSLIAYLLPGIRRPRWLSYMPAVAGLLCLIQLMVEGYRWQMAPSYLLAAIMLGVMAWSLWRPARSQTAKPSYAGRALSVIGLLLSLLTLALTAFLAVAFPIFSLPDPTGPYAVGTEYYYWNDESRPDEYADEPGHFRGVSVQVWYPAEAEADEPVTRYMSREAARALTRSWNSPAFLFDHLALVRTHARPGVEPAVTGRPFPVITYSTSGIMSSHQALFEELASHGYVLVAIGHPYWNAFNYGSDGEALPNVEQNEFYEAWWDEDAEADEARSRVLLAANTADQERAEQRHNEARPIAIHDLRLWAGDIGFVLDRLEQVNQGDALLTGSLDLGRVGVMGFSKGGAAAGQFCLGDERCTAGINLTGMMYGDIVDQNLIRPFFFMSEGGPACSDCYINDLFYKRAENDAYQMKIPGARHTSFGDPCLWSSGFIHLTDERPEIACNRMVEIQNVYSLAFFDQYLKGISSPLLDGPSPDYPDTRFRSNIAQ